MYMYVYACLAVGKDGSVLYESSQEGVVHTCVGIYVYDEASHRNRKKTKS